MERKSKNFKSKHQIYICDFFFWYIFLHFFLHFALSHSSCDFVAKIHYGQVFFLILLYFILWKIHVIFFFFSLPILFFLFFGFSNLWLMVSSEINVCSHAHSTRHCVLAFGQQQQQKMSRNFYSHRMEHLFIFGLFILTIFEQYF